MKMAKASQADLDMALDLISVLDDIECGRFPHRFDPDAESIEWLDTNDNQQCGKLIDNLRRLLNRGSIGRVIMGMAVVCDPSNECIDPDVDTIEHHPKRQQLEKQCVALLAALERLSFAAMCRENTAGDPCRLIQVQAELSAANREAIKAIASTKDQFRDATKMIARSKPTAP